MTSIPWLPNHAYSVGAVVTETTGLPLWRCTTAGTSAGTEPTWATAFPWTTADGPTLVWSLNTTFREDARTEIGAALAAWKAANPDLLRQVWAARPPSYSLGDMPCVAIGSMTESIANSQGVRTRTLTGFTLELVDQVPDNVEAALRMDLLVDAMLDYFNNPHLISGTTVLQPTGVIDGSGESEGQNAEWYAQAITFMCDKREGRP